MSMLTCPLCGFEQDAAGPAVSSQPDGAGWRHVWVPFIEDLRSTPARLVHPTCFADESGVNALVAAVSEHDRRVRQQVNRGR